MEKAIRYTPNWPVPKAAQVRIPPPGGSWDGHWWTNGWQPGRFGQDTEKEDFIENLLDDFVIAWVQATNHDLY